MYGYDINHGTCNIRDYGSSLWNPNKVIYSVVWVMSEESTYELQQSMLEYHQHTRKW